MKNNARTLIILTIVFAVCVGAYIGVSVNNANVEKKVSAEADALMIYGNSRSTPVKISYMIDGQTLSFESESGQWYNAVDHDFPLNQVKLNQLSSALNSLTALRTFDAPEDLASYGLDQPAYTLTAADAEGNAFTLLIGVQNNGNFYARTDGDDKVYTIDGTLVGYLEPDLLNLIILDTLPTLNEASISTIALTNGSMSLTLDKHTEKDGSYTWFIIEGSTYTSADAYVLSAESDISAVKYVSNAVSALGSLSFSSCVAFKPSEEALTQFGLDRPQMTVTVAYTSTDSYGSKTDETAIVEIGSARGDSNGYYARIPASNEINILSTETVSLLVDALKSMGTTTN